MARQTGWHDGGKDNRCFADNGKCPFGGDSGREGHFPPTEEGKRQLEKYLEQKYDVGIDIKRAAISNPNAPASVIDQLADEFPNEAANHPNTSVETLRRLAKRNSNNNSNNDGEPGQPAPEPTPEPNFYSENLALPGGLRELGKSRYPVAVQRALEGFNFAADQGRQAVYMADLKEMMMSLNSKPRSDIEPFKWTPELLNLATAVTDKYEYFERTERLQKDTPEDSRENSQRKLWDVIVDHPQYPAQLAAKEAFKEYDAAFDLGQGEHYVNTIGKVARLVDSSKLDDKERNYMELVLRKYEPLNQTRVASLTAEQRATEQKEIKQLKAKVKEIREENDMPHRVRLAQEYAKSLDH